MDELFKSVSPEQAKNLEAAIRDMFMTRMNDEKREKIERYRHLNKLVRPGQILFVGSSLMEQFPIYELLLDKELPYTIYNRGIGGYTTQELADSLEVCVYELRPSKIFINIGTNDLNTPDYTEEGLIERYRAILLAIREHLPEAKIYTMAYYPTNPDVAPDNPYMQGLLRLRTNARVSSANAAVKRLSDELGLTFIDCNAGIIDEKGQMKAEYAIEGVHMYGDGYAPVLDALLPYLTD